MGMPMKNSGNRPFGMVKHVRRHRLRILPCLLLCLALLSSPLACGNANPSGTATTGTGEYAGYQRYSSDIVGLFDTVISLIAYCGSQEDYDRFASMAEVRFTELNRLFDIYNPYDGLNNLHTVNAAAGGPAVTVAPEIIDLLEFCQDKQKTIGNRVDITLGAMLDIWSKARKAGRNDPSGAVLPDMAALRAAAASSGMDSLVVDRAAGTVRVAKAGIRLDVGAVAKGFAAEIVERELADAGFQSFLISCGASSIILHGRPFQEGKETWSIGMQNPSALLPETGQSAESQPDYAAVAMLNDRTIGNSGDYQNYYTVGSVHYSHLIDRDTLMPATFFRGVSVFTDDCGLSDFLSSTLFLLPYETGRALVDSMQGIDAIWIFPGGRVESTPGIDAVLTDRIYGS